MAGWGLSDRLLRRMDGLRSAQPLKPFSPLTERRPHLYLKLRLFSGSRSSFRYDGGAISSSSVCCHADSHHQAEKTEESDLLRKQNARSMMLLLRNFSGERENSVRFRSSRKEEDEEEEGSIDEEGIRLALVGDGDDGQRAPIFPGSIGLSIRHRLQELPLKDTEMEEKIVRRALDLRRQAAREVLIGSMRASRFSITYSTNLVSHLAEFVDHLVVETAFSKKIPQFANSTFNARAKACIEKSGVVPMVRWLKHNSLTFTQIGKLICLSSGNLEALKGHVEWLKSVHVKGRNIGVVLTKADSILNRSLQDLNATVEYLEANEIKRDWMGFIFTRCPQLLSFNKLELEARVHFYLQLGMSEQDFGTMVFDYPKALGFFPSEEMIEKVEYLKEFGLHTEEIGRLFAFKPQLLGCSIEDKWKPLVKYLYYLRVNHDGVKRILTTKPIIFCVDLDSTIAPKVRFLRDIGIQEDTIGGVITKFPSLLTYSLYKKIRPVVVFLISKAGVSQREVGKVIAMEPRLIGCSITHKLEVNVKYFLSLGISLASLGQMITDFPMLLKYNLDVLRPKYRYLRRTMVRPLHDLIEFPRFFSYSLDDRIIPRHKFLVENQINFKLRYMLTSTDEEFDRRVKNALEKRRDFEHGLVTASIDCSSVT